MTKFRASKGKAPAKLARSAGASPAQVRPSKPPGSECCVRRQQCRTRSVHSGCVGCVIEPRNTLFAGGGGCPLLPNATWAVPLCEVLSTLPGSKSTSRAKGSRRNLGDPAFDRLPERAGGPHREGGGAESAEPRAETKENAEQQSTCRTQGRESVSQALDRIRRIARTRKQEKFTALLHHISVELLEEAFLELKMKAAAGVDGLTWDAYEADFDRRIEDLHARVHSGAYRALPSRRVYIPKPDGRQRPLAIAALEDKIVQRAAAAVLNAIYEEDFLGFSYGFRPGRGAHDAMDARVVGIERKKVNYILDADIRSFFDTVSQEWVIKFVEHRIGDRRMIRLIQKWLKAGVLEDGVVTISEMGTGQGAVISPLLANIYL